MSADLQEEVEGLERRFDKESERLLPIGDYHDYEAIARDAIALLRRLSQPAPTSEPCKWPRGKCPHVPDCYATPPPPAGSREAAPEDAGCICRGNWRAIVKKTEPRIGTKFRALDGKVFTLAGIMHGDDDYYYVMWSESETRLLSCVGAIEHPGHGYTALTGSDKP